MKKIIIVIGALMLGGLILILILNWCVLFSTKKQIISNNEYAKLKNVDCILVLGDKIISRRCSTKNYNVR